MTNTNINVVMPADKSAWSASMYPQSINFTPISGGYIYTDGFGQFTKYVADIDFDEKKAAMEAVGWNFSEYK